jgi:4-hydroxy-tetrahydrodipicolinate reductase
MGRMLLKETLSRPDAALAGGSARPGSDIVGQDLGLLAGLKTAGLTATGDADALFAASDAVIDFTRAELLAHHAELAARHSAALVVGTTGFDETSRAALNKAAEKIPVVLAANMSVGVTLLGQLVRQVAAKLDANDFDIEIVEMHHRHKIDAPSGTALALAQAAAEGRAVGLGDVARKSRDGQIGPRPAGEIGISTVRGGDVVGDHTVIFAAEGERIELTHKASSRQIFARGAVRAALWATGRKPGLYSMLDVLGL